MRKHRKCAKRGCDRWFLPRSSTHRYCLLHRSKKRPRRDHYVRYGPAHRRLRSEWAAKMRAGIRVECARCGERILPGQSWDLGHRDGGGPRAYAGPEHARCNRGTNDGGGPVSGEPGAPALRLSGGGPTPTLLPREGDLD
jgi:hypothetical protein